MKKSWRIISQEKTKRKKSEEAEEFKHMTDKKNNKRPKELESEFKEVYKAWGSAEAEVIKSFLQSHGIPCLLKGLVVQSVHPFTMDGLGEIKILVSEKDHDLAEKLLKSHQEE
jgi:hypothetical protein